MTSVEGDLTGAVLWQPPADVLEWSRIGRFMSWLAETRDVRCDTYEDLWAWSVAEIEAFWAAVWEHFDVRSSVPYEQVLAERVMPGARWFEGARLNYAEHIIGDRHPGRLPSPCSADRRPATTSSSPSAS